jgi:hypothetical protein
LKAHNVLLLHFFKNIIPKAGIIILFLFLVTACGKKISDGNFNSKVWKSDRLACKDLRKALIPEIDQLKSQLAGINETDLQKLLGRPDGNSLADQGEHFYFYYLEAGPQCKNPGLVSSANRLIVRINALNLVTEVTYDHPLEK